MKTQEERFIELMSNCSIEISSNTFPNKIIFFNFDGQALFGYHKKYSSLLVRDEYIWSVLEKEYNMNDDEISFFLKDMMSKYFKINEVIPKKNAEPIPLNFIDNWENSELLSLTLEKDRVELAEKLEYAAIYFF